MSSTAVARVILCLLVLAHVPPPHAPNTPEARLLNERALPGAAARRPASVWFARCSLDGRRRRMAPALRLTSRRRVGQFSTGIGKILFERIAFPIHIPSAEVDCIPTRNPLFSLGL